MKKIFLAQTIFCIILTVVSVVYRYTDIGDAYVCGKAAELIKDSILVHRIEDNIARAASYVLLYIR